MRRSKALTLAIASLVLVVTNLTVGQEAKSPALAPLWDKDVPGLLPKERPPTLTYYPAPEGQRSGAACVVCPGGGYGFLADKHEGKEIADWLNARGITAFVLHYRIVTKDRPPPLDPAPMLDVQRAIRTVRAKAKDLGIDPQKIGVWGFSAGGHLASTAATHFDAGNPDAADPIERVSCRPDFAILAYPVISMDPAVTHGGSRKNLLGPDPKADRVEFYSNDKQVSKDTPPTFLFHTADDAGVPLENSLRFASACRKNKVPVELHAYESGKHGVGLAKDHPILSDWGQRLEVWLSTRNLVKRAKE
jgi:acetyl esterase/lipase